MVIQYFLIGTGVSWLLNFIKSDAGAEEGFDLVTKLLFIIAWPISLLGLIVGIIRRSL